MTSVLYWMKLPLPAILTVLEKFGFKIYQDGMVANDADGIRIIREGISQGSRRSAAEG